MNLDIVTEDAVLITSFGEEGGTLDLGLDGAVTEDAVLITSFGAAGPKQEDGGD